MKSKLSIIGLFITSTLFAQVGDDVIANDSNKISSKIYNWHNKDSEKKTYGLNVEKAYNELLKNKKPKKKVVVAVIDSGVDEDHEDLKSKMWINKDEIPDNNIDDDKNGYIDDIFGWNFLVDTAGKSYQFDSYEATRIFGEFEGEFENMGVYQPQGDEAYYYEIFKKAKPQHEKKFESAKNTKASYKNMKKNFEKYHEFMVEELGKEDYDMEDVSNYVPSTQYAAKMKSTVLIYGMLGITNKSIDEMIEDNQNDIDFHFNPNYNPKTDDKLFLNTKLYGNNEVEGEDASHGTHVAGIIAADRNNGLGVKGICDNCEIMAVRAVPDGDEKDYDVANAIYYAVDNGADIINMSFGKTLSRYPQKVIDAITYAETKNVLFIHAAGNSSLNIDTILHYPVDTLNGKRIAKKWLTVGAASMNLDKNLCATFSNYGDSTVDVFSPGVRIYSTIPDNNYAAFSGTSMAAPATAGVAALVLSYYPELSAQDLKEILIKSGNNISKKKVYKPGGDYKKEKMRFSSLCKNGVLVDAYNALQMAETWKK